MNFTSARSTTLVMSGKKLWNLWKKRGTLYRIFYSITHLENDKNKVHKRTDKMSLLAVNFLPVYHTSFLILLLLGYKIIIILWCNINVEKRFTPHKSPLSSVFTIISQVLFLYPSNEASVYRFNLEFCWTFFVNISVSAYIFWNETKKKWIFLYLWLISFYLRYKFTPCDFRLRGFQWRIHWFFKLNYVTRYGYFYLVLTHCFLILFSVDS